MTHLPVARCQAWCLGDRIDLKSVAQMMGKDPGSVVDIETKSDSSIVSASAHTTRSRHRDWLRQDMIKQAASHESVLKIVTAERLLFVFPNASVIAWLAQGQVFEPEVFKAFVHRPYHYIDPEQFDVSPHERTRIQGNHIHLASDHINEKISIAYALSASVKLNQLEYQLIQATINLQHIPQMLARHGKIAMSRRKILRKIGDLFILRSTVDLDANLLDTPDYFWDRPQLEASYEQARQELDIPLRLNTLHKRMETVHSLYELLSEQVQYQHSFVMEFMILLLIGSELLLSLWELFHRQAF